MKLSSARKPNVPKRKISPERLAYVLKRKKAAFLPRFLDEEALFKLGGEKIRMFQKYDPVDTRGAKPIYFDPQELERVGAQVHCFGIFINECLNNHTLQVYDHHAFAKYGPFPFYHIEGKVLQKGLYRDVAVSAFRWYKKNHPQGRRMRFKEATKMSCSPDCHPFYYITFVVADMETGKEKTLQAQLIQLDFGYWQLGILRDASDGRVLAALQFKPAPTRETADLLASSLENIWKDVFLRKTDMRT